MKQVLFLIVVIAIGSGCKASLFGDAGTGTGGPISFCSGIGTPGDLVCNFNGLQGGANNQWRFVDDGRDRTWAEMGSGTFGGSAALVGQGTAVASCVTHPDTEGCEGAEELIVVSPPITEGSSDAAIEHQARGVGEYTVTGKYRALDGSGDGQIRFYRNSSEDLLFVVDVDGDVDATPYSFATNLQANDTIYMALHSTDDTASVLIAVQLSVEKDESTTDSCAFLLDFENQDFAVPSRFTETCGSVVYDLQVASEPVLEPKVVPSVIPSHGRGLEFATGQVLFPETLQGGIGYGTDFTWQAWLSFPAGFGDDDEVPVVYDDLNNDNQGISVGVFENDTGNPVADALLSQTDLFIYDAVAFPNDTNWHFYRFVLDSVAGTLTQCIDGVALGSIPSKDIVVTSSQKPRIGQQPGRGAYFTGALDDVRVVNRALPCRAQEESTQ